MDRAERMEENVLYRPGREEREYLKKLDIGYSYRLARNMEKYRCNETLGYRTAGSRAEYETGEFLYEEMKRIGLQGVVKDKIKTDCWDFAGARLSYRGADGMERSFELAGYQTQFDTNGPKEFRLVYAGRATQRELETLDIEGKLVLADINQRDEWWISYPVYQAYKKGAAALIAVQESGYGEVHDTALNAQDIGGPAEAAAFSISRADAEILKRELKETGELTVRFDARSTVVKDGCTYNILGTIPGRDAGSMILLSAHYDSYFDGFQDDNSAVAMMLGIAKALLESGYRPEKTLLFCAMAAEEWGVVNSKYDWSTGAFQEVFTVHPEWRGRVIANMNFELPAHAHGRQDKIRCVYEYVSFLKEFIRTVPGPEGAYPDGIGVAYPVETWSDDFSIAISGIPSMVNDFSSGTFMETHYHSQFDNDDFYQEEVYYHHHVLYGMLLMAFDRTVIAPLDFSLQLACLGRTLDTGLARQAGIATEEFLSDVKRAEELAKKVYALVKQANDAAAAQERETEAVKGRHETAAEAKGGRETAAEAKGRRETADAEWAAQEGERRAAVRERLAGMEQELLALFRTLQDQLVRLTWSDEVVFPHSYVQNNLRRGNLALDALRRDEPDTALEAIYEIDNNRYAFLFGREVYDYFTDYVLKQGPERLQWGAGRVMGHEHLYGVIQSILQKQKWEDCGYEEEIRVLSGVQANQEALLHEAVMKEWEVVRQTAERLSGLLGRPDWRIQ